VFGDGPQTVIEVDGGTELVEFLTASLVRLQKGLRAAGVAADTFAWPPEGEPDRAPTVLQPTDRLRGVTSHSTRMHPLSVGTGVLGRWHAATVHFLCPRQQA
jgi:hypothetical protein